MDPSDEPRSRRDLLTIALLAIAFIGPGLALTELSTTDEARYTQVAREMRLEGRWLAPRLNGVEYWEKPALFFDLLQIPQRIVGEATPLGSRLVVLVFAVLALWGTYGAGRVLGGRRVAGIATAILGTNVLFVSFAHRAVLDVPLLACTTAAMLAYLLGTRSRTPPRRWPLWVSLALGAGCLFKGPVAILLPGTVIAVDALSRHRGRVFRAPATFWGPLVALSVLGLWVVPMAIVYGAAFTEFMWQKHIVERTLAGAAPHERPFWFYLPRLLTAWLPWTLLIPAAWSATRRAGLGARPDPREESPLRFAFLWAVAIPVVMSLVASKRTQYLLPAAPGFSIWIALWIEGALCRGSFEGSVELRTARILRGLFVLLGAIGISSTLAVSFFGPSLADAIDREEATAWIESGVLARLGLSAAILFAIARWLLARVTPARLLTAFLVLGVGLNALHHWVLLPFQDRELRPNEFSQEVRALLDRGGAIGTYGMPLNGTYLLHARATRFEPLPFPDDIAAFLDGGDHRAVIGRRRHFVRDIWHVFPDRPVTILAAHRGGRSEVVLFTFADAPRSDEE